MQNIQSQLKSQGVAATVTLRDTGQVLSLNFKKGETRKKVSIQLGGATPVEGYIEVRERPGRLPGTIDSELILHTGALPAVNGVAVPKPNAAVVPDPEETRVVTPAPGPTDVSGQDLSPPTPAEVKVAAPMPPQFAPNETGQELPPPIVSLSEEKMPTEDPVPVEGPKSEEVAQPPSRRRK